MAKKVKKEEKVEPEKPKRKVYGAALLNKIHYDEAREMVGKKFGFWTITKFLGLGKHDNLFLEITCVCGTVRKVPVPAVKSDQSYSCGCKKHGDFKGATRAPWRGFDASNRKDIFELAKVYPPEYIADIYWVEPDVIVKLLKKYGKT